MLTSTDCKIKLLKTFMTIVFLTGLFLSGFHASLTFQGILMSLKMTGFSLAYILLCILF